MKSNSSKYVVIFVLFIGLLLSLLMFKTLMIHTDNTQMMDKAVKYITTGEFIHYGNASTKVGSIPGSAMTFLSAVPMKIWPTPYAAMAVILLFHVISVLLLVKTQKDIWPSISVFSLVVFYWLNPWRIEQSELYNPAYLFLFSTLHLYSCQKMYEKNFLWTLINVLTIGICMQIHFSFLILAFVSFFLFLQGQIKVNWKGFFAGSLLIIISLIPYYIQKSQVVDYNLAAVNLTRSDAFLGRNLILVYPVIKAIIYYFRMGSVYFGRHIFTEINFEWIAIDLLKTFISSVFHLFKWIFAGLTLFVSFKFIGSFVKNRFRQFKNEVRFFKDSEKDLEKRFYNYFFILFVATVLTSALSPVEFNHWHLILCFPAISLFLNMQLGKNLNKKILSVIVIIFIFWGLFAALGSRSHSYKNDYERDFFIHYKTQLNH